jgi:formate dehydrogenase major subunit
MVDAIHEGKLKAMYLFGEEMSIVDSNANYVGRVRQARLLRRAGHLLQQHLPVRRCGAAGSPSLEKEGTFTSTERRIQRLYQVFEPLEGSRPDWKIIQDVANRLGAGWNYQHPSEVMDEIASLTPMFAGVNYERLEGYKSFNGRSPPMEADQPLLYTKRFNFPDGKGEAISALLDRPRRPTPNSTCI